MVNLRLKFMKIKSLIRNHKSLIIILLLAAFLRFYKLDSIPPGLTPDEASLGYNAYSILKTGHDEYGQLLPVIFTSFGDYKPGVYIYLTVPSVAILGLNEFAVRLPGALAGIFAVWLLYLIINWFKILHPTSYNSHLGLIASFLLAINPWHLQFSRGAWEANIALTLTLAGILFFLKFLTNSKFLILSSLFFSLTFITYQGAKLSTAIVVLVLMITFWKKFWKNIHMLSGTVLASILIVSFISIPILSSFFGGKTGRLTVFSVFSYPRPVDYLQNFLDEGNEKVGTLSYYLYHSETLNFTRGILGRWFNHFSGRFLFFEGDYQNPQHSAPNSGMLLFIDLLLLPIGVFTLIKKKSHLTKFTILWLLLSPLPAVLSRDQVHSIRALNMVIPLVIISAVGLSQVIKYLKVLSRHRFYLTSYILLLTSMFCVSFIYFIDAYYIHLPAHYLFDGYAYKQIVNVVIPIQDNYKKIQIQQSFAQPYIYFLFYGSSMNPQKYDPAVYQKQAELVESEYKGDVGYITKLDNIEFVDQNWSYNRSYHDSLIVGDSIKIPDEESKDPSRFKLIKEIKYLDGKTAFKIIEVI